MTKLNGGTKYLNTLALSYKLAATFCTNHAKNNPTLESTFEQEILLHHFFIIKNKDLNLAQNIPGIYLFVSVAYSMAAVTAAVPPAQSLSAAPPASASRVLAPTLSICSKPSSHAAPMMMLLFVLLSRRLIATIYAGRGYRTGSDSSEAEDYCPRKKKQVSLLFVTSAPIY